MAEFHSRFGVLLPSLKTLDMPLAMLAFSSIRPRHRTAHWTKAPHPNRLGLISMNGDFTSAAIRTAMIGLLLVRPSRQWWATIFSRQLISRVTLDMKVKQWVIPFITLQFRRESSDMLVKIGWTLPSLCSIHARSPLTSSDSAPIRFGSSILFSSTKFLTTSDPGNRNFKRLLHEQIHLTNVSKSLNSLMADAPCWTLDRLLSWKELYRSGHRPPNWSWSPCSMATDLFHQFLPSVSRALLPAPASASDRRYLP